MHTSGTVLDKLRLEMVVQNHNCSSFVANKFHSYMQPHRDKLFFTTILYTVYIVVTSGVLKRLQFADC